MNKNNNDIFTKYQEYANKVLEDSIIGLDKLISMQYNIKRKTLMETCKERGWKVGDVFTVISNGNCYVSRGDRLVLEDDDGSECPYFLSPKYKHKIGVALSRLEKIEENNNKYARNVKGVDIDIYDVLFAWKVDCPATQHAIKKLLMPGQRGHKDKKKDLQEAKQAIERAIELLGE